MEPEFEFPQNRLKVRLSKVSGKKNYNTQRTMKPISLITHFDDNCNNNDFFSTNRELLSPKPHLDRPHWHVKANNDVMTSD